MSERTFKEMGELIRTQDNCSTAEPIFVVQQRRRAKDQWEWVTVCFTRNAADAFIARYGHNLRNPRVYVASGYGNPEWIAVRKALMEGRVQE